MDNLRGRIEDIIWETTFPDEKAEAIIGLLEDEGHRIEVAILSRPDGRVVVISLDKDFRRIVEGDRVPLLALRLPI